MLKRTRTWLWILVPALAVTCGAIALSAKGWSDANSKQKQSGDKQKDAKKDKAVKEADQPVDPSQYVGAETCKTCHEQVAASYDKGPHGKTALAKHQGPQWQGCEACHGPGKPHAESADPDKIVRFGGLSREESSKRGSPYRPGSDRGRHQPDLEPSTLVRGVPGCGRPSAVSGYCRLPDRPCQPTPVLSQSIHKRPHAKEV